MRPKLLTVFLFLLAAPLLRAQQTHVDEVSIDTRATFHQQTTDGVYDSHFQGDYLNLHIKGQLTDDLRFRVRQRLNKKGEPYGWPLAVYCTPEHLWGYDHVTSQYEKDPEESGEEIYRKMKNQWELLTKDQFESFMKIRL